MRKLNLHSEGGRGGGGLHFGFLCSQMFSFCSHKIHDSSQWVPQVPMCSSICSTKGGLVETKVQEIFFHQTLAIVMETQSPTYPSTQASFDTCLLNNSFSRDSMPKMKIFESILCFPSQDFGNLKKYIFKKNISTNNIVSVKVAKLLWQFHNEIPPFTITFFLPSSARWNACHPHVKHAEVYNQAITCHNRLVHTYPPATWSGPRDGHHLINTWFRQPKIGSADHANELHC
jgi:hypothetical protein